MAAMTAEELKAKRAGNVPPKVKTDEKKEESAKSFDGSEMPKHDLPEIKFSNLEAMFAQAIKRIDRKTDKPPLMGLIYGPVGSKKTTEGMQILRGIVPQDKIILMIDSAKGWTTFLNYPEICEDIDSGRIVRMEYENIEQITVFLEKVARIDKPPFNMIGGIMFDEYTSMHDSDLNYVVKTRAAQAKADGGFKDSFTPALPDYNAARIRSNILVEFAMNHDIHLMFIGHSKESKKLETLPDMPEKAGKSLYKELHFTYYTSWDKQGNWKMQTVSGNRILAKNRINGIGAYSSADEVIECYRNWGGPVKEIKPEPIPEEELPETDDEESIASLLN